MMKRIHLHWTAGGPGVIPMEADSYHEVIQPDGSWVKGVPIERNVPPLINGAYAAHTLNANSHAIGIACDAMAGAKEVPFRWGSNPLTEAQVETMIDRAAHYCRRFGIEVTRQTVLTHAEVERNLGIPQNAKWDIMVLPGDGAARDPVEVGDDLRRRVKERLSVKPKPRPEVPPTKKETTTIGAIVGALIALVVGYIAFGG